MSYIPNSIEARDVATLVHMQTNLRKHQKEGPQVITRGQGCRVFDDTGRDYIDAVAGLWCASLGFGSERLAQVAAEQMRTLGYYHLYRHRSHEPAVALAETLLKIAPVPMARVVFQCSGSEANDTAIKLAWYYWNALGQPRRTKIIARQMAYHGSTCAAVSLSGKPDMHAGFGLPFAPFKHTEFPHYYRRHEPGETEDEFSARMAEALEALIQAEGADTIAAFFAEPVMGAGGAIVPPQGYFEKMQAVLRKYDILFVADEVICGFARTGEMWGSQTYALRPDMITSAKALSAAMQPISAVLIILAGAWIGGDVLYGTIERLLTEMERPDEGFRLRVWPDAVAMWWSEAPIAGTGLGSFAVAFPRFRTLRIPNVMSHAESDWLGILVETGAIGFVLAAATAVSLAVMLLRRRRHSKTYSARVQALAGLVALIGAAVQSLPNYNLPVMSNLIYLSLALIIAQSGPTTAGGVIPGQEES